MTVLPDPFATMAKADNNQSIASLSDMGYRVTGLVFTERALFRKNEAIRAFYVAYNRAIGDLQSKPLSEFSDILTEEIGFPAAMIPMITLPEYSKATMPAANDLEAVGVWLKSRELIPEDFNIFNVVYSNKLY